MSGPTLLEVERLVDQLPPPEQLKLASRICERLAEEKTKDQPSSATSEFDVDRWLAECDALVESETGGPIDAAEDLRKIRLERCGSSEVASTNARAVQSTGGL